MLVLNKISSKVLEINVCIQLNTCRQVLEEKTTNFSTDLFASSWYSVFTMYNLRLLSTSQCPLSRLKPGLPSRTRCCCWRWSGRRSSKRWSRSRLCNHHRNSIFEIHIDIRTKRSDRWLWSKRGGRRWRILQRTDYKAILEHHRKPHLINQDFNDNHLHKSRLHHVTNLCRNGQSAVKLQIFL